MRKHMLFFTKKQLTNWLFCCIISYMFNQKNQNWRIKAIFFVQKVNEHQRFAQIKNALYPLICLVFL